VHQPLISKGNREMKIPIYMIIMQNLSMPYHIIYIISSTHEYEGF